MEREELINKMQDYCDSHPVIVDFNNDDIDKKTIERIVDKGKEDFHEELYELNLDYIFELETYFKENELKEKFEEEIRDFLLQEYTETEIEEQGLISDILNEVLPCVNLDIDRLLDNTSIIAMLKFYSNYDCTNSFDTLETSEYLQEVYKAVKKGASKDDFMWEHANGAYGGSLFVMPFQISLLDFLKLKEDFQKAKKITIPEGTSFGFLSTGQGACSVFEKCTTKNITLNIQYGPTNYDHIGLVADVENYYGINDITGCTAGDFKEVNFKLK